MQSDAICLQPSSIASRCLLLMTQLRRFQWSKVPNCHFDGISLEHFVSLCNGKPKRGKRLDCQFAELIIPPITKGTKHTQRLNFLIESFSFTEIWKGRGAMYLITAREGRRQTNWEISIWNIHYSIVTMIHLIQQFTDIFASKFELSSRSRMRRNSFIGESLWWIFISSNEFLDCSRWRCSELRSTQI